MTCETLEFERRLSCELSEVTELHSQLDAIAAQGEVTRHQLFYIKLVTEELFTNFVSYGRNCDGTMTVRVNVQGDRIRITTSDDGRAFDPNVLTAPDTEADLADRPVGGLGIFLLMEVGDSLTYDRRDGRNVVTLELTQS